MGKGVVMEICPRKTIWFVFVIGFFGYLSCFCEAPALIESIHIEKNHITVIADQEFAHDYLRTQTFFAEYDADVDLEQLNTSICTIPFIMNVIPMVWVSDQKWVIDIMDADLYYSLEKIKKVFKFFYPSLNWDGQLVPRVLVKNKCVHNNYDCAALFSGGLDAVCTSMRNYGKKQLLITICGSDVQVNNENMWQSVKDRCIEFGQNYCHDNVFIRSNFAILSNPNLAKVTPEIKNWWGNTLQSLGYTSLTMPLLFLKQCNQLFIGSTRTHEFPYPYGTHPLIDNAISCAGITVIHDGAELDRLEKIKVIDTVCNKNNIDLPPLRVCWGHDKNGGNCCECEKCLRTIHEILAAGYEPHLFGFDKSIDNVMDFTRDYFSEGRQFKAGLAWHWQCIQNYIKKNKENISQNTKEYLLWLSEISISPCKTGLIQQDKDLFAELWHQSCAGNLNYAELAV